MKTCDYCGKENEDGTARCVECGTEFAVKPSQTGAEPPWEKIATINNEVEAERLDVDLNGREIPHLLQSYSDPAFSGLYQTMQGWGHVEAPAEQREAILSVLKDIRESRSETASTEPDA